MTSYQHSKEFIEVPIQNIQNYWNHRPCNIQHSNQLIGTKEYFEEIAARKFFVEPHLSTFADFSSMKGKKVLEIGCGIGTVAINFALAGADVTTVDLSEKSIEIAKKNAGAVGVRDKIQFFQGNAEKLSEFLPKKQYDLIFSFGVIHHTPRPENVVQEFKKYLAPKGKVKVMVYYRYSWKVFWILARYGKFKFWQLSKLIARYSEAQTGCPVTYAYSQKNVRRLMEDKGFCVENIDIDHIFPYRISDYKQYRYIKVWYFRFLPKRVFRFLEKKFGWHLCLTAS